MKAIRHFWRISPEAATRCLRDASYFEDVINGDEEGVQETFDVDKAWDAIHFVISANRAYPDQEEDADSIALDHAIKGTKEFKGLSRGYGAAGMIGVDEVKKIASLFDGLSPDELKERFDPEAMDTAEVYPEIWLQEADAAWDYVRDHFERLREFYKRAAAEKSGVATWIIDPPEPE